MTCPRSLRGGYRAGFEPMTLRTKDDESANEPPHPRHLGLQVFSCFVLLLLCLSLLLLSLPPLHQSSLFAQYCTRRNHSLFTLLRKTANLNKRSRFCHSRRRLFPSVTTPVEFCWNCLLCRPSVSFVPKSWEGRICKYMNETATHSFLPQPGTASNRTKGWVEPFQHPPGKSHPAFMAQAMPLHS